MSVTLKIYCDGSGSSSDPKARYLTLAGYIGNFDAWEEFKRRWAEVLKRWGCSYLHMVDAWELCGEYSGWTKKQVTNFIGELFNNCFVPIGRGERYKGQFYGVSCTVNLDDNRKAAEERKFSRERSPEALCVWFILMAAIRGLPDNPEKPLGKEGSLELYFDENERFINEINKMRRNMSRSQLMNHPLGFLAGPPTPRKMCKIIGIQAADFLAWQTNRYHASNPQHDLRFVDNKTAKAALFRVFATRGVSEYYDYKKLKQLQLSFLIR